MVEYPKSTSPLSSVCFPKISANSSILTILTLDLKDGLLLTPGIKLLFFISPTIFAFKSVFVVLTICPTTLSFPSSNITCKSTKFVCLARSIVKLTKTLLSTISLISPNI